MFWITDLRGEQFDKDFWDFKRVEVFSIGKRFIHYRKTQLLLKYCIVRIIFSKRLHFFLSSSFED